MAKTNFSKKVSRAYRVTTLFDLIVKRGSKTLGASEADFIELCVLGNAEEVLARRRALERMAVDAADHELAIWAAEARKLLAQRLNNSKD